MNVVETEREKLRLASYSLLKRCGWKPGDTFSMHSVSELMIAFAFQDRKTKTLGMDGVE